MYYVHENRFFLSWFSDGEFASQRLSVVSLRQRVRTLRGNVGAIDFGLLGWRESVTADQFSQARRVFSEMTLKFVVESGVLLFFFGVSITLVVLKGVSMAQSEFKDSNFEDSELEELEKLEKLGKLEERP